MSELVHTRKVTWWPRKEKQEERQLRVANLPWQGTTSDGKKLKSLEDAFSSGDQLAIPKIIVTIDDSPLSTSGMPRWRSPTQLRTVLISPRHSPLRQIIISDFADSPWFYFLLRRVDVDDSRIIPRLRWVTIKNWVARDLKKKEYNLTWKPKPWATSTTSLTRTRIKEGNNWSKLLAWILERLLEVDIRPDRRRRLQLSRFHALITYFVSNNKIYPAPLS